MRNAGNKNGLKKYFPGEARKSKRVANHWLLLLSWQYSKHWQPGDWLYSGYVYFRL